MDWKTWHTAYDDPDSSLSRRLETVRGRVAAALDQAGPGPLRAISLCAGESRDLVPVLAAHPRGRDVRARLVELDPELAARARAAAAAARLTGVEVVVGDAGLADHCLGAAPADLVLVCGVYGNISAGDAERTVAACAGMCAAGGTVIWTRGRDRDSAMVERIRAWYAANGFEEVYVSGPRVEKYVGAHRLAGEPVPLTAGTRLFRFVGHDVLGAAGA
jgi:hypothetical protein